MKENGEIVTDNDQIQNGEKLLFKLPCNLDSDELLRCPNLWNVITLVELHVRLLTVSSLDELFASIVTDEEPLANAPSWTLSPTAESMIKEFTDFLPADSTDPIASILQRLNACTSMEEKQTLCSNRMYKALYTYAMHSAGNTLGINRGRSASLKLIYDSKLLQHIFRTFGLYDDIDMSTHGTSPLFAVKEKSSYDFQVKEGKYCYSTKIEKVLVDVAIVDLLSPNQNVHLVCLEDHLMSSKEQTEQAEKQSDYKFSLKQEWMRRKESANQQGTTVGQKRNAVGHISSFYSQYCGFYDSDDDQDDHDIDEDDGRSLKNRKYWDHQDSTETVIDEPSYERKYSCKEMKLIAAMMCATHTSRTAKPDGAPPVEQPSTQMAKLPIYGLRLLPGGNFG